mmetsp:Transcript_27357/g.43818  ORF Transcript_27357/g.43818 Transcript_27357/m.43818 type:complete len:232 (-) Transcript_27357:249-944(-)
MNLLGSLAVPAAKGDGRGPKRAAVSITADEGQVEADFREMLASSTEMRCLVKLTLQNAQRQRLISGAITSAFRVNAESHWVKYARQNTQAYGKAAKAMRTEKGSNPDQVKEALGLPHIHCFNGLLQALLETVTDSTIREKHTEKLKSFQWRDFFEVVKIARVEDMFEQKHKRLVLFSPHAWFVQDIPEIDSMRPIHYYLMIVDRLQKTPHELEGQAPSEDLEALDEITEKS